MPASFSFTKPLPLSLYIHIPWCVRKCPYCDFNSHAASNEMPESEYINRLICDLDQNVQQTEGRELTSIFFGGGTPSLFKPESIDRILVAVRERLAYQSDIEITLEANPGTVEQKRFAEFRAVGVNRLSIGVQSFQDKKLKALGRIHDSKVAIQAAEAAHSAGFSTFNLDLMYGLPDQSIEDALLDIQTAVALAPTHLSWYHLTIEPNTLFHHRPPPLPHEEHMETMQTQAQAMLAEKGFTQYEVSAYCKPQHACKHNMNYWTFGDYLGIGAGAHGKITSMREQIVTRYWKTKHPKAYLDPQRSLLEGEKKILESEMPFEFMLNALRLYQPISWELFETQTGLPRRVLEKPFQQACEKGLLDADEKGFTPTALGHRFLDDLVGLWME